MKKIKLLALISSLPLTGSVATVCACNNKNDDPEVEPNNVHEFINDRTFSICEIKEVEAGKWSGT